MRGRLKAENGARFSGRIQKTDMGPQASFLVKLDMGGRIFTESDLQLCETEVEAENWLKGQAAIRGFPVSFPIDRDDA
jgi:hypothetical protein